MDASLPVSGISDTAFLTAYYRAIETMRPDAHFRDPHARELAGERGQRLASDVPGGESVAPGCIVRTSLIDESIVRRVETDEVDVIVNLGCGFDTRPYRLSLPHELRWFDVDLPSVIAHKAHVLADVNPCCHLESIALDLADRAARCSLFQRIAEAARRVLIVAEGLLGYMTPGQVGALAQDLHKQSSFLGWICEVASPLALTLICRGLGGQRADSGPALRFAPEQGPDFFARFGWAPVDYHSCFEAGRRLQRWIMPEELVAVLTEDQRPVLRTLTGVLTLKRMAAAADDFHGLERPNTP